MMKNRQPKRSRHGAAVHRRSRTRFEAVIGRVLRHEDSSFDPASPTGGGRVVDHPSDPGGCTRLGITLQTLRDHRNEPGLGPEALAALTLEEIKEIYYVRYWLPVRADELPVGLDYAVFDFAVHSGPRRAATVLQQALGGDVKVDGVMGPQTVAAARAAADLPEVIREYCARRLVFLSRLPHASVFGRGWRARVRQVEEEAVQDALRGPELLTVREAVGTRSVQATGFLAGVLATVTAVFEQIRPVVPLLEGLPVWAVVAVMAMAALVLVVQWRRSAAG